MIGKEELFIAMGMSLVPLLFFKMYKFYNVPAPHVGKDIFPQEIKENIFSFFKTPRELATLGMINTSFRKDAIKKMDELKHNNSASIFYSIGLRLHTVRHQFADIAGSTRSIRIYIPFERIYASFRGSRKTEVKLFNTWKEALDYSLATKTFNEMLGVTQAPVFEVIFLNNPLQYTKERIGHQIFTWFTAGRDEVIPLKAYLNNQHYDCKNWQTYIPPEKESCTIF